MAADKVPPLIPGGKQFYAIGLIDTHAANKKRGADVSLGNRFQNAVVGFRPFQCQSEGEPRVVEREGELRGR